MVKIMEENIKNKDLIARCVICGQTISGETFEGFKEKLREHVEWHKSRGEL